MKEYGLSGRSGIEVMIKNKTIVIGGEVHWDLNTRDMAIRDAVSRVFKRIGRDRLRMEWDEMKYINLLSMQSEDISLGVDKGGAGDQGIMFGFATNDTDELMPVPYMVATKFLRDLKAHPSRLLRADAKAQVTFDYDESRITTFLCSVQHSPDAEVEDFRHIIVDGMRHAAIQYGLNTDFQVLINPTGRFVIGGSFADCGVTGRKLVCDTYGGFSPVGGGAMSGKDPTKVDRSAAYMARKICRDIVKEGAADEIGIQIAYAIGVAEPVSVEITHLKRTFGVPEKARKAILDHIKEKYDLRPAAIIERLGLAKVDYRKTAVFGHFGKPDLPWEQ